VIEECHSFLSEGAMWEWHSFFSKGAIWECNSFFFFPILFLHHCGLHILGSKGTLNVIYLVDSCHKISFKFPNSYMYTSEKKNLKKLLKVFKKRALKECILFMKERSGSATPFFQEERFGSATPFFP
jgi:hypothetical protein